MDKNELSLNATSRTDLGTAHSRRARRANLVPAVIYGGANKPQHINLVFKDLTKLAENELFHSQVLELKVEGNKKHSVIVKALQRHPVKDYIIHADFQAVSADTKVTVNIPLHFEGEAECVGVRRQGGTINHHIVEVEVVSLPQDLPEYVEVNLSSLESGQIIHLSDLQLPEGVQLAALMGADAASKDGPVVSVAKPKGGLQEEDSEDAAGEDS